MPIRHRASAPVDDDEPAPSGRTSAPEPLAVAVALCHERGAQLTGVRRTLLEILWQAGQPLTAYALIPRLEATLGRSFKAPSVYRALDFLTGQRLVTRIESLNAYAPCCTPGMEHTCIFLLCGSCGTSREISDPGIENLMARDAEAAGFHVGRWVVELHGTCASCSSSGEHSPIASP